MIVFPLLSGPYLVVSILLFLKYKDSLEPVHVQQINHFCTFFLANVVAFLAVIENLMGDTGEYCPLYYFTLGGYIMVNQDILSMQMDRVIALRWPYFYKSHITTKNSTILVVCSKFVSFAVGGLGYFYDPEYGMCTSQRVGVSNRVLHMILNSYPKVIISLITVFVTIYMIKIKLKGVVVPINSNLPEVPTVSRLSLKAVEVQPSETSATSDPKKSQLKEINFLPSILMLLNKHSNHLEIVIESKGWTMYNLLFHHMH